MATEAEIVKALRHLRAGYPAFKQDPDNVQACVEDLADLRGECLLEAARQLRRTSKWMPSIAEIREATLAIESIRVADEQMQRFRENHDRMIQTYGQPPSAEAMTRVKALLVNLVAKSKQRAKDAGLVRE